MNTRREKLTARVAAVNKANAYANELYVKLADYFRPLVGQKILKADGSLLAKIEKDLPEMASGNELHVYRHRSEYSLAWTVKTCEFMPPHGCMYHETTVYVADLKGQTLGELSRPFEARSDYTVEGIEKLREAYETAKKAADNARSALFPFGEYDN